MSEQGSKATSDQLRAIAHSGVLAPSADNHHVFRIEFLDSVIRLWPTPEFASCTDPLRRVLGLISLGAVVENMQLRAGELGLLAHTGWSLGTGQGALATLDFDAGAARGDDLAAAIPHRHTNRRMYRGPLLSISESDQLAAAVAPVDGVRLLWLTGAARRRALNLIWRAESERFLRRRLHEDLFASIRFDLDWHEGAQQAIPPGALEVEPPLRPMFKALRHWALMWPLTWLGVHRLLGLRAGLLPCWQAPALGLLTTSLPLDEGAAAVGAALERLWLRATQLNLALQPVAGSVVLPLQSAVEDGVSEGLRAALDAGWRAIAPNELPLMLFRIGRAARPIVTAGRRLLEDYLIAPAP